METKKVLVAGGNGFIGANLCRYLASRGNEVHTIVRSNADLWRLYDLQLSISIHKVPKISHGRTGEIISNIMPDVIVNAIGALQRSVLDKPMENWDSNFMSLVHLLNASKNSNLDTIIHTGSSFEYGKLNDNNIKIREDMKCNPLSDYALTKYLQTEFCKQKGKLIKTPIAVLRLFNVFGQYGSRSTLIPQLILKSIQSEKLIIHNPLVSRDFIHINDVVRAFESAVNHTLNDYEDNIYNVGSGKSSTVLEVGNIINNLFGSFNEIKHLKSDYRPENEFPGPVADITKINEKFGWKPEIELREGLNKTVEWYREHSDLYEIS